jgi:hypothetical protein
MNTFVIRAPCQRKKLFVNLAQILWAVQPESKQRRDLLALMIARDLFLLIPRIDFRISSALN